MKTVYVIDKNSGESLIACYAANRLGNMRMNVRGKFYSDKEFNKKFVVKKYNER